MIANPRSLTIASTPWSNPDPHEVGFPNEMCAYSGYYRSENPDAPDMFCTEPR